MELQRQTSRRRNPRPESGSEQPAGRSESIPTEHQLQRHLHPHRKHQHQPATGRRWALYLLPVCLLTALLFWGQLRAAYSPSPPVGVADESPKNSNVAAALRPHTELRPHDHIYRDPTTQHFDWTVTADLLRPDGVLKRVFLINGLFPGPTVETRPSDTLIINVTNSLHDEPLTVHWHGLHIHNSMDGVAGVTQCAIPPGSSFVYNITIPSDQSGTFWYHAHTGLARADGLYGGLVVHEPAPKSTVRGLMARENTLMQDAKEVLLLIGDWYHRPAIQVMAWYMRSGSFGNEPVPDSLLVNGRGYFKCSMAVPARPVDCIDSPIDLSSVLPVDGSYKVRVVNTGSLAGFTLTFKNHDVTVLEVDSVAVQPQDASGVDSAGILYPGQRMDLFVCRYTNHKQSTLTVDLDRECFAYPNRALTPTQIFSTSPLSQQLPEDQKQANSVVAKKHTTSAIDIQDLPSADHILSPLPKTATVNRTEVVYTKIEKLSIRQNVPYGFFNRTSWVAQEDPPIPVNTLERARWDKNQFGITIDGPLENSSEEGVWVDLVVNNLDEGGHPFHMHGYHFYILTVHQASLGWGSYNPFVNLSPPGLNPTAFPQANGYNLSRAMLRDTVYIPSRGYAVIRFRADNPGTWLFHCHILWHSASGMVMLVDVGGFSADPGSSQGELQHGLCLTYPHFEVRPDSKI